MNDWAIVGQDEGKSCLEYLMNETRRVRIVFETKLKSRPVMEILRQGATYENVAFTAQLLCGREELDWVRLVAEQIFHLTVKRKYCKRKGDVFDGTAQRQHRQGNTLGIGPTRDLGLSLRQSRLTVNSSSGLLLWVFRADASLTFLPILRLLGLLAFGFLRHVVSLVSACARREAQDFDFLRPRRL